MRRQVSIVLVLAAWLLATGSQWDLAQTFAWGRMITTYSASMPLAACRCKKPSTVRCARSAGRSSRRSRNRQGTTRPIARTENCLARFSSLARPAPRFFLSPAPRCTGLTSDASALAERGTVRPAEPAAPRARLIPPLRSDRTHDVRASFVRDRFCLRAFAAAQASRKFFRFTTPLCIPPLPIFRFHEIIFPIFSPIFSSHPSTRWRPAAVALLAGALIASSSPALACSVCGCSLSSDWGQQGYSELAGFQASLRDEYFEQADLRSGLHSVNRAALAFPNDDEIQQSTTNRNVWLGVEDILTPSWAVSVQIPWHDRDHTTIAAGDTGVSASHASGMGDIRILGRYQLLHGIRKNLGFQFGLKLPTGRFEQDFATGPQAGTLLDRGLQLGTGTTDLLLGAAWFARPMINLGVFAQALVDQPLAPRDGFSPSSSLTFNSGARWLNSSAFTPQLQVNVRWDGREHGVNADIDNSGGTVAYLSPGVTADVTAKVNAFAFVQLPVYQRVTGLQLEPRWLLSAGFRFRL